MTTAIDQEITKHTMSAYGWNVNDFYHSTPFISNVFYIRDFRTEHIRLFTVSQKDFDAIKVSTEFDTGEYVSIICHVLKKIHKGQIDTLEEQVIGPSLIGYIKNTACYRQWLKGKGRNERLHAMINIYADSGEEGVLRPAIVCPSALLLTGSEFMEYSSRVQMMDKAKHPEWFR